MKLTQSGFTLFEVLVSVFVLALGVIGAAGMQLTALRTTQQSSLQTTALELASEMADKMRANANQMKLSDDLNPFLKVNYYSVRDGDPAAPATLCFGNANCDAQALADFDIYEWKKRIKLALPGGRAMICRDASPWDSAAGAFRWGCGTSLAASNGAPMVIKLGWQGKNPDGTLIRGADQQVLPSLAIIVEPYTK